MSFSELLLEIQVNDGLYKKNLCLMTGLFGMSSSPEQLACAQNVHWDLSQPTHVVFLILFLLRNALSSLNSKIIPQILHFSFTLEADFTASVRSFIYQEGLLRLNVITDEPILFV